MLDQDNLASWGFLELPSFPSDEIAFVSRHRAAFRRGGIGSNRQLSDDSPEQSAWLTSPVTLGR
jgi:hypothetical protein